MFVSSEQGRILSKIITAWFLCTRVAAGDTVDVPPHVRIGFAPVENARYRKDVDDSLSTNFQRILPVQVDFGNFVNSINHQILGMEGKVSNLSKQVRIIEEKDARLQKKASKLKEQLEFCNESKAGVEEEVSHCEQRREVDKENFKNVSRERNSLKEENSRLREELKTLKAQKLNTTAETYSPKKKFLLLGHKAKRINGNIWKGWRDAREECKRRGGDLATHLTKEDLDFLFSTVIPEEVDYGYHIWIGGILKGEQATESNYRELFEWVDGDRISADDGLWSIDKPGTYRDTYVPGAWCMAIYRGKPQRRDQSSVPAFENVVCDLESPFSLCEIR